MWYLSFSIIFVAATYCSSEELHKLPSYITRCNRTEIDIKNCVAENVRILKSKLKDGVPDLFIPSVNPLVLPPTTVNEQDRVKLTFKDIQVFNVDELHIDRFDVNLKKHIVNVTVTFPKLRIKANYNVKGKFLVFSFDENGPADGNYTNFQLQMGVKGTSFNDNGREYILWEKDTMSVYLGKSHIVLENLFGNHTDIKDETNKMINENIDVIINDLQPVLQKVISDFVFGVVNGVFSNYSIEELFLN